MQLASLRPNGGLSMKKLIAVLIVAAMATPVIAQAPAGGAKSYTAAYVIEPTTKRVLFEENAHTPMPTASMAKMMTLLIVMEEIRDGRLSYDTKVRVSPKASKMGGSQVYLKDGQEWPVRDLIIATMVHSANDAAQALAEKVAGSTESFADLMNQRAQELGLKNSRFYDPHGLPNNENKEANNVMSAHDLAMLGIELMKHPYMRQLAVINEMPFRNGTLEKIYNPNRLLDFYEGATGIKTGYSGPAGFCVTASAKRGDLELVAVVMGSPTSRGPQSSFENAARLMNQAFVNYRMVTPVKKGAVVGQASVNDGRLKSVPVVAASDARALVKRGQERGVKVSFSGNAITAPVRRGQPVGTILVKHGDQTVAKIPAVAAQDVQKQPWWKAFWPF